jgi:hypothetical protein
MVYLQESGLGGQPSSEDMDTGSGSASSSAAAGASSEGSKGQLVEEDEVDKVLSKVDGRIIRKKDPQL